jgi:lipopolysaccharide transport system permease protein
MTSAHKIVIRPSQPWLHIDWHGFVQYRELLVSLVHRDFTARFKQTIVGPLWFLINPLITTAVFVVFFGRVAGIPTDGIPGPLFYLSGLLAWNFFSQIFSSASFAITGNLHLFSKVYFPRLIVPAAQAVSAIIPLGVQLAAFAVIFLITKHDSAALAFGPTWGLLLLPLLLAQAAMTALGFGLVMSWATVKYRDLQQLAGFLLAIWMYATPIVYPLSRVPAHWQWAMALNPMTAVVEGFRFALLGVNHALPWHYAMSAAISAGIFLAGAALFQRSARTYIDFA